MKNYTSWIIAGLMVVGLTIGFIGLDFDQTQVAWKVPLATPMIAIGFSMFVAGFIWLCTKSR